MKIYSILSFLLFTCTISFAQKNEQAIINVLNNQVESWNHANIEGFMDGYWKHDSMKFIGQSGIRKGWLQTLNAYKKGYPDSAAMGILKFDILSIDRIDSKHYMVTGKWFVHSSKGELNGIFTLVFKRIKGHWKIIIDHTC